MGAKHVFEDLTLLVGFLATVTVYLGEGPFSETLSSILRGDSVY